MLYKSIKNLVCCPLQLLPLCFANTTSTSLFFSHTTLLRTLFYTSPPQHITSKHDKWSHWATSPQMFLPSSFCCGSVQKTWGAGAIRHNDMGSKHEMVSHTISTIMWLTDISCGGFTRLHHPKGYSMRVFIATQSTISEVTRHWDMVARTRWGPFARWQGNTFSKGYGMAQDWRKGGPPGNITLEVLPRRFLKVHHWEWSG